VRRRRALSQLRSQRQHRHHSESPRTLSLLGHYLDHHHPESPRTLSLLGHYLDHHHPESPRTLDPPGLGALLGRSLRSLPAVLPSAGRGRAPGPFRPHPICCSHERRRWTSQFQRGAYLGPSARPLDAERLGSRQPGRLVSGSYARSSSGGARGKRVRGSGALSCAPRGWGGLRRVRCCAGRSGAVQSRYGSLVASSHTRTVSRRPRRVEAVTAQFDRTTVPVSSPAVTPEPYHTAEGRPEPTPTETSGASASTTGSACGWPAPSRSRRPP
jgi:hypothetical protein